MDMKADEGTCVPQSRDLIDVGMSRIPASLSAGLTFSMLWLKQARRLKGESRKVRLCWPVGRPSFSMTWLNSKPKGKALQPCRQTHLQNTLVEISAQVEAIIEESEDLLASRHTLLLDGLAEVGAKCDALQARWQTYLLHAQVEARIEKSEALQANRQTLLPHDVVELRAKCAAIEPQNLRRRCRPVLEPPVGCEQKVLLSHVDMIANDFVYLIMICMISLISCDFYDFLGSQDYSISDLRGSPRKSKIVFSQTNPCKIIGKSQEFRFPR